MGKRVNKIFWLGFFSLLFWIFRSWFGFREISGGDAGFYFPETLKSLPGLPYLWFFDGLGGYSSLLSSFPYLILPLKLLSFLGLSWGLIERIAWYWPFLILGIFSSWYLLKTVLPEARFKFLAPFVYLFNTYILMIVGGGQVSIFLPYAIAPLVLGLFIKLINCSIANYLPVRQVSRWQIRGAIITGLVLALQVSFEPRIAFVTLIVIGIYLIFQLISCELRIANLIKNLGISFSITGLLHFYWLLPSLVLRKTSFSPTLVSEGWAGFLSFARFSNSFSLLHPNWPENIFGKTYFFRPEFLILPILAFSSLLFINSVNKLKSSRVKSSLLIKNRIIVYFSLVGLMGAFLAKGVNPPFGEVYIWLFENVPGMNLFRDPTKFYLLIALAYSVLIPFSIWQIYEKVKTKLSENVGKAFILVVTFLLLFLIKPAWVGKLTGTFRAKSVPHEYLTLKDFISEQNDFFRTFWIPKRQRFGFYSNHHPALNAENFVIDSSCREPLCSLKGELPRDWLEKCLPNERCFFQEVSYFLDSEAAQKLSSMAVKYVIVPYDSQGEIFMADRRYSDQQRENLIEFLDSISWLKRVNVAGRIAVYESPEHKDHFFIEAQNPPEISWQMASPTKYKVQIKDAREPFKLVFSESYDELWQAKVGEKVVSSEPFEEVLNSFRIAQTGDFEIIVEFIPQKYVYYGGIVSIITLISSVGVLLWFKFKKSQ